MSEVTSHSYLTVSQAIKQLTDAGVPATRRILYSLIESGELPSQRLGLKKILIPRADFEAKFRGFAIKAG